MLLNHFKSVNESYEIIHSLLLLCSCHGYCRLSTICTLCKSSEDGTTSSHGKLICELSVFTNASNAICNPSNAFAAIDICKKCTSRGKKNTRTHRDWTKVPWRPSGPREGIHVPSSNQKQNSVSSGRLVHLQERRQFVRFEQEPVQRPGGSSSAWRRGTSHVEIFRVLQDVLGILHTWWAIQRAQNLCTAWPTKTSGPRYISHAICMFTHSN